MQAGGATRLADFAESAGKPTPAPPRPLPDSTLARSASTPYRVTRFRVI